MNGLLERAFAEASKLPTREQEALATWILAELASEQRWAELLSESEGELAMSADEALIEHRAGRTQDLDPDKL
jgi:hypothetical protein